MKRLLLVLSLFLFVDGQAGDYDDLLLRPDQYEAYTAMLKEMHERAKRIAEKGPSLVPGLSRASGSKKQGPPIKPKSSMSSTTTSQPDPSPSFVPGLSRAPGLKKQGPPIKPRSSMSSTTRSQPDPSPSFVPGLSTAPGLKKQGQPIKPRSSMSSTTRSQLDPSPSFVPGLVVPPPSGRNTYASFDQGASKGYEEPQVTLRQLQVSEQGNNGDGDASCGYHAIKNAMSILSGDLTLLNNVDFVRNNFDVVSGKWRRWVADRLSEFDPEGNGDTDWIGVDMLGGLINHVFPYKNYSIISSDGRSCDFSGWGKDELAKVKAIMNDHNGKEYKHAFFINTANLDNLANGYANYAHWFTLVVDKKPDNSVVYTVTDSLGNASRINDRSVLNVIKRLSADQ